MILKHLPGSGWRGLDVYISANETARTITSTLGGSSPRDRAREIAGIRSRRPGLRKAVAHLVLSQDPIQPALSTSQWERAIEIALIEHGYQDCPHHAVLHEDRDHRHVHVAILRLRSDTTVASDSQSYRKNARAARAIEAELGLVPPQPMEPSEAGQARPTRRGRVAAERRIRARQRRAIERCERTTHRPRSANIMITTSSLRERIFGVLELPTTTHESAFKGALMDVGVRCEFTSAGGVRFGELSESPESMLPGSALDRGLSGAAVRAAFSRNSALASGGVQQHREAGSTRLDLVEGGADSGGAMQERSKQALARRQPATPVPKSAPTDDREIARAELHRRLRELTIAELDALRAAALREPRRPLPEFDIARLLLDLIRLVIRIFTLGAIDMGRSDADPGAMARHRLVVAIDFEFVDRHQAAGETPGSLHTRARGLKPQVAAARAEADRVRAQPASSLSEVRAAAMKAVADGVMRERSLLGKPTLAELAKCCEGARRALAEAEDATSGVKALLRGRRDTRDRAEARLAQAVTQERAGKSEVDAAIAKRKREALAKADAFHSREQAKRQARQAEHDRKAVELADREAEYRRSAEALAKRSDAHAEVDAQRQEQLDRGRQRGQ